MNFEGLAALMGLCIGEPALRVGLLREQVDISKCPPLPEGEYRTYLEMPDQGVSLVFTDEAMFLGKGQQAIGSGPLFFSGLFLYSQGKDGYDQFRGQLPEGLEFADSRATVLAKLGEPSWQRKKSDGSVAAERWERSGKRLHITYTNDARIEIISVQVPDAAL
ncbi:MAG TPA: hypothetical protein VIR60_08790 [Gammaproteobacteria bacterium]